MGRKDEIRGVLGSLVPQVYTRKIILESPANLSDDDMFEHVNVTLDLTIDEEYRRKDLISNWAANKNLLSIFPSEL